MNQALVIQGKWQDGATSAVLPAQLHIDGDQVSLVADGTTLFVTELNTLEISPRLGNTPRYLTFLSQAGQFETIDHANVSQLDQRIGSGLYQLIHRMEQHLLMVVLATLVVVAGIGAYFIWGIPAGSKFLAQRLPETMLNQAARETLLILEKHALHESELSSEQQAEIRDKIASAAPDYPIEKLRFYRGGDMGANAFALPDHTIIFTDELIQLAENQDEIISVFGHELGHVKHRHALRQMLQGSAISVTIALISGDVSALGDVVMTAPLIFTQLSYSRKFELESDAYAIEFLRAQNKGSQAFISMLQKIHHSHSHCEPEEDCAEAEKNSGKLWEYLSTHPHLEERIRAAEGGQAGSG